MLNVQHSLVCNVWLFVLRNLTFLFNTVSVGEITTVCCSHTAKGQIKISGLGVHCLCAVIVMLSCLWRLNKLNLKCCCDAKRKIHLCPFTKKKNSSGNLLSCFCNFLFNLSDFWGFTQHCAHEIALCSRERWWFSSINCPSKPWPMQNLPKVECSPYQLNKLKGLQWIY